MPMIPGKPLKPDKQLHNVEIDWTGHRIKDGHGYYGEPGNAPEPAKEGAFPPPPPNGPDDLSRRRFSPAEKLKAEIGKVETTPSAVTSVTYRDGAEVVEKPGKPGNTYFKAMWAELRANPDKMAQYLEKKKAGFEKWRAKRKEKKHGG